MTTFRFFCTGRAPSIACLIVSWLLMLTGLLGLQSVAQAQPILLIASAQHPFTRYYEEVLRAEGLNEFATADIAQVTPAMLTGYDVALLGEMPLTSAQVTILTQWVAGGGNLVAMRPDSKLAPMFGLATTGTTLAEGYLKVNTASTPGKGIVSETMQFHGVADRYMLNGATVIAQLYVDSAAATANPAVVWKNVGSSGGLGAAFTYDLARSVVYTRQGNPAWAAQERDSQAAIRPDDLFFPDYVNLDKVAIPQADEQQRLLANLIIQMNLRKKPLPRFWYLPSGLKAAIVHTLDDHNTSNGTRETVAKFIAQCAPGCSVADWKCLRATVWAYPGIAFSDTEAATNQTLGFEFGVHAQNGCTVNFTSFADLDSKYKADIQQWRTVFPSVKPQTTSRFHCLVWSDWITQPKAMLANGIRYSMDYYYWPGTWVRGRPGLFTGSGLPMRFADTNGTLVDVYQGVSQLVNENDLAYPAAVDSLLDKALGSQGYYGLFGTHDDYRNTSFVDGVIATAKARGVPIITARQALTWLDGRNNSSFTGVAFSGNALSFTVNANLGARSLMAMLPLRNTRNTLSALTRGGVTVPYTSKTIKGIEYAMFAAPGGTYVATYGGALPALATSGITLWTATTVPQNTSSNDANAVELGLKFRSDRAGQVAGIRFYKGAGNVGAHNVTLWTNAGAALASGTAFVERDTGWQEVMFEAPVNVAAGVTYVASYYAPNGRYAVDTGYFTGADITNAPLRGLSSAAVGGNGVFKYGPSGFPVGTYNANNYWVDPIFVDYGRISLWPSGTPAVVAYPDTSPVETGVKFRSSVAGKIYGIRFYKGVGNNGPHVGTLWTEAGVALRSVTFANETVSGWQEMLFSAPVDVQANVTYVASYFAPSGNYAVSSAYFANADYVNDPLRALANGAAFGNGVYKYGAGFPNNSYNATNYWVDVIFGQ